MENPLNRNEALNLEQFTAQARGFAAAATMNDAGALAALGELAALAPGDRALDVACGPGIVSVHLARSGAEVVGLDLTPAMLGLARDRADGSGFGDRLSFVEGRMDDLPFDDGEFTAAVSRYALHHAADPAAAAREMARVVQPAGRIVVVDFAAHPDPAIAAAYDEAERLRDPSHARNLTAPEQRELFQILGFEVVDEVRYGLDAELESVLARSHGTDHDAVRRIFADSVDSHGLGVDARLVDGALWYTFPLVGVRLQRSA